MTQPVTAGGVTVSVSGPSFQAAQESALATARDDGLAQALMR